MIRLRFAQLAAGGDGQVVHEQNVGALVLPEQITVGRAAQAFDDMDNLKEEAQAAALKTLARRLIDMAGMMPHGAA